MGCVIDPAARRPASGHPAQGRHKRGFPERHDQSDRKRHRPERIALLSPEPGNEGAAGQEGADEQAPAIAHEQARPVHIPGEESEKRPRQGGQEHRCDGRARFTQNERRPQRRDRSDAGSQAIDVVEQVDRMDHRREPDYRQHDERRGRNSSRGLAEQIDEQSAQGERPDQLGCGPQRESVIDEAEDEGAKGRPEQSDLAPVAGAERQRREEGARCDGYTSQERGWFSMPAIRAREADHADPHRPPSHQRAKREADYRGAEGRQESV